MHKILTFVFAFILSLFTFSQVTIPPDIKKIQEKEKAGEEVTEEEEETWTGFMTFIL
jgi:hypothetical protein